jgi:tetratricopeptide repeat protein 21B
VDLLIRLKPESAQNVIDFQLANMEQGASLEKMMFVWRTGRIAMQGKNFVKALECFEGCYAVFESNGTSSDPNSIVRDLRIMTSDICVDLALALNGLGQKDRSVSCYEMALKNNSNNMNAFKRLFGIFRTRSDPNSCCSICAQCLKQDPTNEEIAILYSDTAWKGFRDIFDILVNLAKKCKRRGQIWIRMTEIGARLGALSTVKSVLESVKCNEPGWHVAKGIYYMYKSRGIKANRFFRQAVKSPIWERICQIYILSILMNPSRDFLFLKDATCPSSDSVMWAEKLMEGLELSPSEKLVYMGDLEVSRKTKESIEKALLLYRKVAKLDAFNLKSRLGLAKCFYIKGKWERARRYVEEVVNVPATLSVCSTIEEAAILMSQTVKDTDEITGSLAYLNRALEVNQSCSKAWELRGNWFMKQERYEEAATSYARYWKLSRKNDVDIGYNYAFCCMKAERYEESLTVAHHVLQIHPAYKDLQDKVMRHCFGKVKC